MGQECKAQLRGKGRSGWADGVGPHGRQSYELNIALSVCRLPIICPQDEVLVFPGLLSY